MALTGSSSPHFYLARSRSTSLPPLSSSSSSKSSSVSPFAAFCSALTWPNHVLPSLALAFDEPSFFADLRVDINPISTPTPNPTSSTPSSPSSSPSSSSTQQEEGQHSTNTEESSSPRPGQDCVWVHRMVVAVHSPVFRSLLRSGSAEAGGSRESREGVIDMRGPQHPPGRVVRCLLKMMYSSPGLAIDELGHEPKLSDEWEFLLQLFKLAHLYQVEVVLDACTRRLKHILEQRKDTTTPTARQAAASAQPHRRGSKAAAAAAVQPATSADADINGGGGGGGELSDEDEERTRQTCYALELLAFLLHIKEAETSDHPHGDQPPSPTTTTGRSRSAPEVSLPRDGDGSGDDVSTAPGKKVVEVGVEAEEAPVVAPVGEQREEMLMRMLDHHLYPQLAMIVQHIRCEDVLTLQHLLQLSVCTARPSSPTTAAATASLTPPWPGGMRATSHAKLYSAS